MQAAIEKLCQYLRANAGEPVTLAHMAREVGVSPYHLQRSFKAAMGVTPRQFHEACRMEKLRNGLQGESNVTTAMYEAGFNSSSRLYEKADARLGMTPSQYRRQGRGVAISYVYLETRFGLLLLAATDRGLCAVRFGESRAALEQELAAEFAAAERVEVHSPAEGPLADWTRALDQYLTTGAAPQNLPLDAKGTAFQVRVWRYLQSIPSGQTRSYSEVAAGIGQPTATRAVARACATNPLALAIPCHRVIRAGGAMAGYRWGLERKEQLLHMEREAVRHN